MLPAACRHASVRPATDDQPACIAVSSFASNASSSGAFFAKKLPMELIAALVIGAGSVRIFRRVASTSVAHSIRISLAVGSWNCFHCEIGSTVAN